MMDTVEEYVTASCEQVLETMFFTGVIATDGASHRAAEPAVKATVRFEGPADGQLSIGMESHTAAALASSFLGRDLQDITPADSSEVASELANMICGAILSRCASSRRFRLSPAHVGATAELPPEYRYRTALQLPEGNLEVSVQVDRQ
jgi:CheY-specific phosphatase CheX